MAELSQHTTHPFELLAHEDRLDLAHVLATRPLICRDRQPGSQPRQLGVQRGVGEPRLRQASLDSLDLAQQFGYVLLERLHVFDGREARQPIGEAALNLSEHLGYRMACVPRAKVGRQLDARTREAVDVREGHRQDVSLRRQRVLGTRRSCEAALDGERLLGARRASQQYIHRILIDVTARRPRAAAPVALATAAPATARALAPFLALGGRGGRGRHAARALAPLEVEKDAPSPIGAELATRGRGGGRQRRAHSHKSARLHEGQGVARLVEQPAQLIAQHRIRIERRMQLGACLESIHLQGFVGREARHQLLVTRLQLRQRRLLLEGVKRLLDEALDVGRLDAHAVEQHIVRQVEA